MKFPTSTYSSFDSVADRSKSNGVRQTDSMDPTGICTKPLQRSARDAPQAVQTSITVPNLVVVDGKVAVTKHLQRLQPQESP